MTACRVPNGDNAKVAISPPEQPDLTLIRKSSAVGKRCIGSSSPLSSDAISLYGRPFCGGFLIPGGVDCGRRWSPSHHYPSCPSAYNCYSKRRPNSSVKRILLFCITAHHKYFYSIHYSSHLMNCKEFRHSHLLN